ncbi:MAG: 50S ribosomal protein L11 methyltransferase [Vicinamibacterales bacterium]
MSGSSYGLLDYGDMIADTARVSAYARALEARITPSSVVLDIGTGPGLLALLACRAGAARVYAVEPDNVIQVAREVAAANGFADRIQFVQAVTTDVVLPERVDGIVADVRGTLPLFGRSLVSILDARARLLKPGGWIVPARDTIWAALACSSSAHTRIIRAWTTEYGFDLSAARVRAANQWCKQRLDADDLLVEPQCWAVLDYDSLQGPNVGGPMRWMIERAAEAHGFGVWFDAETAPGIGFSNSPASREQLVYGQAFFAWPEPIALSQGDEVRIQLRADLLTDHYLWGWDTQVLDVSGREKVAYQQSSWLAARPDRERLRKRADTFVARPNEGARIDRCILDLMHQRLPSGEIATRILEAFPASFKDWDAALTRVGDLSDRYSE